MPDVAAIGAALATRFGASTPPTGYDAIVEATHLSVGDVMSLSLPRVHVLYREGEHSYGSRMRTSDLTFDINFYYAQSSDVAKHGAALHAWHPVLMERLIGQVQLGLSASGVTHAVITGDAFARISEHVGIVMRVLVHTSENVTPVA